MTLAILIVSCVFFMSGKVRSDIVALCALLALLIFGILTPAEALSGFASPVVIMMVGLFVVGAGIFRTGLAKMISSRILRIGGKNENVLFVLVMLVTALIGAFVSNTGTVAVMLPIVMSMAASSGISSSRYLMPMAFASSMGLFTLISTPPNLVIQEALVDAGMEPLGFFSFAPVGAVVVAVGIGVLYFLSRLLVRKDEGKRNEKRKAKTLAELVEEYNLVHLSFQVEVPAASPMVGRSLKELRIGSLYDVSVGRIIHAPQTRFRRITTEEVAGPESVILAGDVLHLHGSEEHVDRLVAEQGLVATEWSPKSSGETADTGYAEAFIMPNSHLINHTVADSRFRELYNVNVLGIKRHGEYDLGDMRDVKMHAGDSLLIQGTWDNITALEEAYTSINWASVVLIAAMIPMSTAFDKTGITAAISGFLLHGLGDIGPQGLLAMVYFVTSLTTMFISNTATAVLFAPIAMDAALRMGVSPYPFLFAVAVSASMCFASPFSTPPNALVMSAGGYRFGDYIRVGLPLQVVMGVVMIFVLPLLFPF